MQLFWWPPLPTLAGDQPCLNRVVGALVDAGEAGDVCNGREGCDVDVVGYTNHSLI
jgi:hypothetical protein